MRWEDDAILLSSHRHGETSAVISLLTREHGRHAGLVKGGAGKAARASLQPGNRLLVGWQGRLAEQLGTVRWELADAWGSSWLNDPDRLAAVAAACAMADAGLPERQPFPAVFEGLAGLLGILDQVGWQSLYVYWEIGLLAELGYRLDLANCAVTGQTADLAFVSPRSGRAVSRSAAAPYGERLLALPEFLIDGSSGSPSAIAAGLKLTGHFLDRWVFGPQGRQLPPARQRFVERLQVPRA